MELAAIVLAGGTGARLGGVDKAAARWRGRTFLDHVLDAVAGLPTVVVGDERPTPGRDVAFVREDPPGGGPGAGLLAGLDAVPDAARVLVLAVDMPRIGAATVRRLLAAAEGRDGSVLLGVGGRRQLALALDVAALRRVVPDGPRDGLPVHRLLTSLDLAEVAAVGTEAADVDTPEDLEALGD